MGSTQKLLVSFTCEDLKAFTGNFSKENYLGETQFGKLYRGKISHDSTIREVTVKIWEYSAFYCQGLAENKVRLDDEITFLRYPSVKFHPNLVKLVGWCKEDDLLGVVYDLNPLDTLHNLILKDSFSWIQRINVAIQFSNLLLFLHDLSYMVRNLAAAHIMIDKDFNPILCDFAMLSGGIMGDKSGMDDLKGEFTNLGDLICGARGYVDTDMARMGGWSLARDIYAFAVIVLSMIAKRVVDLENAGDTRVGRWAEKAYVQNASLVHKSLEEEEGFYVADGVAITGLAMSCVRNSPWLRPTIAEILVRLQNLHVVQTHHEKFGIGPQFF